MQEVMGELEGVQFQQSIEDFWVALQELAKEPDSIVTRATLIQCGVNFVQHAENIYERHEVITAALMKMGAKFESAEENACRIEHVISDDMLEVIKEFIKK